jgi:hypothetical protein
MQNAAHRLKHVIRVIEGWRWNGRESPGQVPAP